MTLLGTFYDGSGVMTLNSYDVNSVIGVDDYSENNTYVGFPGGGSVNPFLGGSVHPTADTKC